MPVCCGPLRGRSCSLTEPSRRKVALSLCSGLVRPLSAQYVGSTHVDGEFHSLQPRRSARLGHRGRPDLEVDEQHGRQLGLHRLPRHCRLRLFPPASAGECSSPAFGQSFPLTQLLQVDPATMVRSDGTRVIPPVHPSAFLYSDMLKISFVDIHLSRQPGRRR